MFFSTHLFHRCHVIDTIIASNQNFHHISTRVLSKDLANQQRKLSVFSVLYKCTKHTIDIISETNPYYSLSRKLSECYTTA